MQARLTPALQPLKLIRIQNKPQEHIHFRRLATAVTVAWLIGCVPQGGEVIAIPAGGQ